MLSEQTEVLLSVCACVRCMAAGRSLSMSILYVDSNFKN